MTLNRIMSVLGAVALGGVLVSSTYGAQAVGPPAAPAHGAHHSIIRGGGFTAPMPHPYGPNGMRMGLHCDSTDMS